MVNSKMTKTTIRSPEIDRDADERENPEKEGMLLVYGICVFRFSFLFLEIYWQFSVIYCWQTIVKLGLADCLRQAS